MSLALYRKYRSATFADLIGQEHIAATLRSQVRRGEVAHAYLLTGIRGTGKTSSARILARAVTCLDPQDGEPCNRCAACLEVLGGAAVDVLEIDAASNRGIDEMRDLREKVKFSPASLRRKVYIVDEAHMLTPEAWNAFLKTLEEPPDHVLFILATTEPHKVPETVRSRVQRFDFRRVPTDVIAAHLERIVGLEGAQTEPGAIALVAQAGQGSVRDALSVLDQALATGERPLTAATVRRALGLADPLTVRAILAGIAGGDAGSALRAVASAFDGGADARQLLREMARLSRGAELLAVGARPEGVTQEDQATSEELSRLGRRGLWVDAIDRFAEAEINLRQPVDARLQVELAVLRLAQSVPPGLEERLARLEARLGESADPGRSGTAAARGAVEDVAMPSPAAPAPAEVVGHALEALRDVPPPAADAEPEVPPPVVEAEQEVPSPVVEAEQEVPSPVVEAEPQVPPRTTAGMPADAAAWSELWPRIIEAVNRRDPMLAGVLRSCRPVDGGAGRLVIGAPFGFHLERLHDRQKAPLLADAVAEVAGAECAVEAVFSGDAPPRRAVPSRALPGSDGVPPPGTHADTPPAGPDPTATVLAAFPGSRITGTRLHDSRLDGTG